MRQSSNWHVTCKTTTVMRLRDIQHPNQRITRAGKGLFNWAHFKLKCMHSNLKSIGIHLRPFIRWILSIPFGSIKTIYQVNSFKTIEFFQDNLSGEFFQENWVLSRPFVSWWGKLQVRCHKATYFSNLTW